MQGICSISLVNGDRTGHYHTMGYRWVIAISFRQQHGEPADSLERLPNQFGIGRHYFVVEQPVRPGASFGGDKKSSSAGRHLCLGPRSSRRRRFGCLFCPGKRPGCSHGRRVSRDGGIAENARHGDRRERGWNFGGGNNSDDVLFSGSISRQVEATAPSVSVPIARAGLAHTGSEVVHTLGASLTLGRRYGGRVILDRQPLSDRDGALVLFQIGGYISF